MDKLSFYLNNQLINPPNNWRELMLEINDDKDAVETKQTISITDFDFSLENSKIIHKFVTDGLISGVGIFEGLPFRIENDGINGNTIIFDGYLNLPESGEFTDKVVTTTRAVQNYSLDWLNDVADGFSFETLYKDGDITKDDIIKVPYIISAIPDYIASAVSVVGIYVIAKEVKDAIQKIIDFIPQMPLFYVFSSYIRLILYIVFLILLIIALIKMIKQLMNLLLQPVKYHSAMKVSTLLERGASKLGLTLYAPDFQSGGNFENAVIIPEKYYVPENKKNKNFHGYTDPNEVPDGFYKGTFADLIRDVKPLINGKVRINGNQLNLVRTDVQLGNPLYTMPDIEQFKYRYNADEFKSNTYITFKTDMSDNNTLHYFTGTSFQVQFRPKVIINNKMVLMKGLNEVRFNMALGKEKTKLTLVEDLFDTFTKGIGAVLGVLVKATNAIIKVLNVVINAVNKVLKALAFIGIKVKFQLPNIPLFNPPNFSDTFTNRIGMLALQNDYFNDKKIVLLDIKNEPKKTKVHASNSIRMTAKFIYNNYYFVNDFIPTTEIPNGNQFIKKIFQNVPFTIADYLKVKKNLYIFANNGLTCKIDSLKFNPFKQIAEISLRIPQLYTTNLYKIETEPDGQ
jgi:hypothetical protein